MSNQLLITVNREYGSGGRKIANRIAEAFNIPILDRKTILDELSDGGHTQGNWEEFDEKPKSKFLSRTVRGMSNSPEHILAEKQFEIIKKKADNGESFVVIGRCGETALKGYDGLVRIFIEADMEDKIKTVMDRRGLSEAEAKAKITKGDKERKEYHNEHAYFKWGDSRYYDIVVNSSRLGHDGTANLLIDFIKGCNK